MRMDAAAARWAHVVALLMAVNAAVLAPPLAAAESRPIEVVALGDSLTAGLGLPQKDAFPAKLEAALKARGHNVRISNAGVSGDTTAAGLARLDWAVPRSADAVIVELGANDALRGVSPKTTRANLDKLLANLDRRGVPVLLAGMRAPENWGEGFSTAFNAIFPDLAKKYGTLIYPFFLEGVALETKLNLDDGLHPNARGVDIIIEKILPMAEALVARAEQRRLAKG